MSSVLSDIYGDYLPANLWHGSTTSELPETLRPAADNKQWWNVIDHETFLDPHLHEGDEDQGKELLIEIRTAYGNAVYEAFRNSDDQTLKGMAENLGLDGLGKAVSIVFVTGIASYAERYGAVVEIDHEAEGILAAIPDENLVPERESWLLVLKAGSRFPKVSAPSFKM